MTQKQLEQAIDYFSKEEVAVIHFKKLPKAFREVIINFFINEKEKEKNEKPEVRNPDTCFGSSNGNVCECCDDECINNPNQN